MSTLHVDDGIDAVVRNELEKKIALRLQFLSNSCSCPTQEIHAPIVDMRTARGHLNPAGLGDAEKFSQVTISQSTVAFDSVADYKDADKRGISIYGAPEYGVVGTVESERVSRKFVQLHGGYGAVVTPSGVGAISTVFHTFLKTHDGRPTIIIPDNRYGPAERMLSDLRNFNPQLLIYRYSCRADATEIESLIGSIRKDGREPNLIYLEAPGSQTYEIADIDGIIAAAKKEGIPTAFDNSWASHVRFKPLDHGIDVVMQATTKYEGGYGDTPSGVIISKRQEHHDALSYSARVYGGGAIDAARCNRLYHRVDSTEERLHHHYNSAKRLAEWFKDKPFVSRVLAPFQPESPDYPRFREYFGRGNGLLTVEFAKTINERDVHQFLDRLLLFRIGESWASHVSLALPISVSRSLCAAPEGQLARFSTGLESSEDLIKDLEQAAPQL